MLAEPFFHLFLLVSLVIVYGSLYPFRLIETDELAGRFRELLGSMGVGRSRGDVIANLALFFPLGLLGVIVATRRGLGRRGIAIVALFGAILGLALQFGQLFIDGRVPSLSDAMWNAAGTILGGGIAVFGSGLASAWTPSLDPPRWRPVGFPLLLGGSWLAYRLLPFVPSLDWGGIKDGLKPLLLHPELSFVDVLRNLAGWLAFALMWELPFSPNWRGLQLALVVPLVLAAEVLIVHNAVTASNVVGALAAFALYWAIRDHPGRFRLGALVLGVTIVTIELAPFRFAGEPSTFRWLPFYGFLGGSLFVNLEQLFSKFFWYGSQIWLWTRAGTSGRSDRDDRERASRARARPDLSSLSNPRGHGCSSRALRRGPPSGFRRSRRLRGPIAPSRKGLLVTRGWR